MIVQPKEFLLTSRNRADNATLLQRLNEVRKVLQSDRTLVDENGYGVFTIKQLLDPLGYYTVRHAIVAHLSQMRVLVKGDRQSDLRYAWRIDMTRKTITKSDLAKSRARILEREKAEKGIRTSNPKANSDTPVISDETVEKVVTIPIDRNPISDSTISDPLQQIAAQMENYQETIRRLEAENAQLCSDNEKLRVDNERLRSELAVWREGVEDLRRQIRDIDTTLDQLPHQ